MAANEYVVSAQRVDAAGSMASCKNAQIVLDTALPAAPTPSIRQSFYLPQLQLA